MLNTPSDSLPDAAPVAPPKSWRRRGVWVALLAVVAGMALVFVLRPEQARVERLAVPEGWPRQKVTFMNSLVRRIPMWVWRARDWVRGPRRGVMIQTRFATLERWSEVETGLLGLRAPALADTNGLRVWFIPSNQVTEVRLALFRGARATMFSSPRVQTADGMPSMIMSGVPGGGSGASFSAEITAWFEPVIRGAALDLKAIFSCVATPQTGPPGSTQFSTRIRAAANMTWKPTNGPSSIPLTTPLLDPVGVRVQLREGEEMLVVQEKRAALGGKPFVILVKAAPVAKK